METRTAIITGASGGVGLALVEEFLALGFTVVGNARTADRLGTAAARLGDSSRFVRVEGDIGTSAVARALFNRAIDAFSNRRYSRQLRERFHC